MHNPLDQCLQDWAQLGIMFGITPSQQTPDIEILLLRTATHLPGFPRLLPTTVTWLANYESLVCRHRLAHLAQRCEDDQHSAALGLTLALAQQHAQTSHLNVAIAACRPTMPPQPMFEVDRRSRGLARLAQDQACALSQTWGLWTPEPQLKHDALRPAHWLMDRNPSLHYRAVFAGNLRASILTTLAADPATGESESALAAACSVTRKALREALDHLAFCGLIQRLATGTRNQLVLTLNADAA